MPRDGSGNYSTPSGSWTPATNGNSATASDWNALLADIVAAIQGSLAADGQTTLTGNLNFGNNKGTALAAATTTGDALRLENLIAGADIASASTVTIPLEGNYFKITGTTTIAGFASTRAGRTVWVKFDDALTLTNSTTLSTLTGADVTTAAGDVSAWLFDGTNWLCLLYRKAAPDYTINYLVVGGGGGGSLGGGGAGGYQAASTTITSGNAYTITVGAGGAANSVGGNSSISGVATAYGGGLGGKYDGNTGLQPGGPGGSGGGGGGNPFAASNMPGGSAYPSQGYAGGYGYTDGGATANGGGGGGSASAGTNASSGGSGVGGAGTSNSISGASVTYAVGGSPGGGAGAANTGNGGGSSAAGGSGVVIISYPGAQRGTGGTVTSSGGYTIHKFTSSGTFNA